MNLRLKDQYKEGVEELGFSIEDILEQERDAALGNGGLGRLAACYLDSSASQVCSTSRSLFISQVFTSTRNSPSGVTV
jgi:glucan phosphorylase